MDALPVTLSRFIEGHFDTVSAVEVLLLLHRDRLHRWSSRAVAWELRLDPDQTDGILAELGRRSLVRRRGTDFEYSPTTADAARAVEMLADLPAVPLAGHHVGLLETPPVVRVRRPGGG